MCSCGQSDGSPITSAHNVGSAFEFKYAMYFIYATFVLICSLGSLHADFAMPMELDGYLGIQWIWAWAQVVPMDIWWMGRGREDGSWIGFGPTPPAPNPTHCHPYEGVIVNRLSSSCV